MNYYDLLGISPQATPAQVRDAYRRLAKQYHPDKFHRLSDTAKAYVQERMLALNEAYRVLSDPEERQKYHQETRVPSISSKAYARYIDLDWKLTQLLGQEESRKRTQERLSRRQTLSLPWFRGLAFPLFFVDTLARQAGFAFDLIFAFFLLGIGTENKQVIWRSKTGLGFWLSYGVLWGWIFFVSPNFPFTSASDLHYGMPILLFLLSEAFLFRLNHLYEVAKQRKQNAFQEEVHRLLAELRTLEHELFGSENHPFSQTRYN